MSGLPVRPLRNGGQVQELAALTHVQAAQGHQHQGPARAAHAGALRPGTGQQVNILFI